MSRYRNGNRGDLSIEKTTTLIKKVLFSIALTLIALELILRLFDPLGVVYLEDIGAVFDKAESGNPYTLAPGVYRFNTFTATILADRSRLVPDNSTIADCVIVAIGDSVTFGHGVNDKDTWVNLLARQFQGGQFINTGMNGYNSHAVREMQAQWVERANGFIYLVTSNDSDPQLPSLERDRFYPYLSAYLLILQAPSQHEQDTPFAFLADIAAIQQTAPTLVLEGITYSEVNSYADPHPNAAGHEQIASAILPMVRETIQAWCNNGN